MVQKHRELLRRFFANATCMLMPGGEVHVSHKLGGAHDGWQLEEQAGMAGFALVECVPFQFEEFPGYASRRGADKEAGRRFPLGKASTYIFAVSNVEPPTRGLNTQTEGEGPLTAWDSIVPEIVDLKAKLVQKGQASKKTSLLQVLVHEVTRLEKVSDQLGKKKVEKLKLLNYALTETKLYLLQGTSALSVSTLLGTTSMPPRCLCEFCGGSLKRTQD